MTALHAMTCKGRYWITPHRWGGWRVIDSTATKPIGRVLGNHLSPLAAWEHIKRLDA